MNTNTNFYKWFVVALLWFTCFFNYADRVAIFSVFPLLKSEFNLTDLQLSFVGSAFMYVYAGLSMFAGMVGDRFNRKTLIISGLIFWSLVTVATALSQNYWHLVLFRALEGFGEAFYFPASMALISDYHGSDTRSRAMSVHQSSVYAGTIAGGAIAGVMAQYYGWRSGFYLFGIMGTLLGFVLIVFLKEPKRGQSEVVNATAHHPTDHSLLSVTQPGVWRAVANVLTTPMAIILILVFIGANFVASTFLTWMPTFLYSKFKMSIAMAGLSATIYLQLASILGAISGGFLADYLAKRYTGGRMMAQSIGLILGIPFIFLTGWTTEMSILIISLIGVGYFKGIYDSNIWASLYDVVKPENRATAVGVGNTLGWLGAGLAPMLFAAAFQRYGMGATISAYSIVYLVAGLLLIIGIKVFMQPRGGNVKPLATGKMQVES
jgi:MFS family permease